MIAERLSSSSIRYRIRRLLEVPNRLKRSDRRLTEPALYPHLETSLRSYLALTKPKITLLVIFVGVASLYIAGRGQVGPLVFIPLIVSGGLGAAASSVLNNYLDRDIDTKMARTRRRPLPRGTIAPPKNALVLATLLTMASLSVGWTLLTPLATFFVALGMFFYVVVYTVWLKRNTPLNIVIGGFAGSCAALAGWASYTPDFAWTPVLLASLIFLWTPSHFWALALRSKDDYGRAGIPMLPNVVGERRAITYLVVNTLLLVPTSLALYVAGAFGLLYLLVALLLGAGILYTNIRLIRSPSRKTAWSAYKFSSPYLALLLAAMMLDVAIRS